jgi:trk system potassium uptake protein TrkA
MRVIFVGEGKILYFLARQFASKGHTVTIVNSDQGEAGALSRRIKATVMQGDGSDPGVLEKNWASRSPSPPPRSSPGFSRNGPDLRKLPA